MHSVALRSLPMPCRGSSKCKPLSGLSWIKDIHQGAISPDLAGLMSRLGQGQDEHCKWQIPCCVEGCTKTAALGAHTSCAVSASCGLMRGVVPQ